MSYDDAKKHPLWPAFREWVNRSNIRVPPVISDTPNWWPFWLAFLAGATVGSEAERGR